MQLIKVRFFLLAVMMGMAALFISIGLLGLASPALAQEREPEPALKVPVAQPSSDDDWDFVIVFTDPAKIQITDLAGTPVGEAVHRGSIGCDGNNCSQATHLKYRVPLTDPDYYDSEYEYKFTTRQAVDPDERSAVVAGEGTISANGQAKRFDFTATFRDNRDGTVWVKYEATRPDASFIIAAASGRLEFGSR